jgi:CubicO group peptidase (beta-lactamase class C family)
MLHSGVWDDRVVVPSDWIARSTSPVVGIDEFRRYGYHWYLGRKQRFWNAAGYGGQQLFVIPELDLVVATTAGNYDMPDNWVPSVRILREVVLPALL